MFYFSLRKDLKEAQAEIERLRANEERRPSYHGVCIGGVNNGRTMSSKQPNIIIPYMVGSNALQYEDYRYHEGKWTILEGVTKK